MSAPTPSRSILAPLSAPPMFQIPTTTRIPTNPTASPSIRSRVGFSSGKTNTIAMRAIKGVAPLIIPASADETLVSPNPNSIQGIDTHSTLATKRYFHDHRGGSEVLVTTLTMIKVTAPNAMRENATPTGVNTSSPTMMK